MYYRKDIFGFFNTFMRYNVVALVATSVDFILLILLTELFGLWYLQSAVIGAVSGGVVAFIFERTWVFRSTHGKINLQLFKYVIIWMSSIALNTSLLYISVDLMGIQYIVSKVIVAVIVGIGFNFLMHKYFIFKT
jgi:putative flippase GtrA